MRLKGHRGTWARALLGVALLAQVCPADHLPPESQARGRPEKRLAGILLGRSTVSDVVKMYGEPARVEKQAEPAGANWADTYDYYWATPGARLHLLVYRGREVKGGESIALVEVEGARAEGAVGRTGSGLKLGDDLADVKRIYGRRLRERKLPALKIHDVLIQWRREEFSLVAEFDDAGKIRKLSLSPPE